MKNGFNNTSDTSEGRKASEAALYIYLLVMGIRFVMSSLGS